MRNKQEPRTDGHIDVENHGAVLVARIDGGPHALFDAALTKQLKELVDRADKDPNIHAVVFTGAHPDRFLSHADVAWLQEGGVGFPPINTRVAGIVSRMARVINKLPIVRSLAGMTRLKTLLQLDALHATFLKMNASGTIFVAALNGSALAIGAECRASNLSLFRVAIDRHSSTTASSPVERFELVPLTATAQAP